MCFFNSFYTVQAIPPYILGPGDVIDIYAVDSRREDILENPSDTNSLYQFYQKTQEATNAHQVEVDQEGKIYFPYVGFIEAKGKSLREFEIILQKKLSKFVDHPQVRIKIKTPKNISVYVFGDLDDPGVYQLTDVPGQTSIFNLLRVAKAYKSRSSTGANLESNVASSVSIARRKGPNKWEYVELAMNSLTPDMTDNDDLYLRDGDRVLVTSIRNKIYVIGQVVRPGPFVFASGSTLSQYISESGGFTHEAGDEVVIYPGNAKSTSEIVRVKLEKNLFMKDPSVQPLLQPGTIIYVTRTADFLKDIEASLLLVRNLLAYSVDILDSENAIRVGGSNRTLLTF